MSSSVNGAGSGDADPIDVVLIGGGIMSATLAALISALQPDWSISLYERLGYMARESSNSWNNAGTGHAALCEVNYTPVADDGTVDISKAIAINDQFRVSLELWDHLIETGLLPDKRFLQEVPHMTFVRGEENQEFLRSRHAAMSVDPHFSTMEFTTDPDVVRDWAPLLMEGRNPHEPVAATRVEDGTDVDFGLLTRHLFKSGLQQGTKIHLQHEVKAVKRNRDGTWRLRIEDRSGDPGVKRKEVRARFVFVGAGGGALLLLQKSHIPEIAGYAGFPISGQFLRTTRPDIASRHHAKVYGKAEVGAPPMSVPHLDTRVVDGVPAMLFGPYAGFSPKFLKHGSLLDLVLGMRPANLRPQISVALKNWDLERYLVSELVASEKARLDTLRGFYPNAVSSDWEQVSAGMRVQVIKPDPDQGGVLQFGTEVITSDDGTIAGLLGASPGASTAAYAMTNMLLKCFPDRAADWIPQLDKMMPSLAATSGRAPV